jgi:hypothetical protein
MPIVIERSFTIDRGSLGEFERLSREGIWPYMEARGCKILGLFTIAHGGPSDEVILLTAYDSFAHWEATRLDLAPPPGSPPALVALLAAAQEASRERNRLTRVSSTRALRSVTDWMEYGVHAG